MSSSLTFVLFLVFLYFIGKPIRKAIQKRDNAEKEKYGNLGFKLKESYIGVKIPDDVILKNTSIIKSDLNLSDSDYVEFKYNISNNNIFFRCKYGDYKLLLDDHFLIFRIDKIRIGDDIN